MNYELTKRVLPAILLLLITAVRTKAQSNIDFEVDGIAYHITSEENKTVEVTKDYSGGDYWNDYPQYTGNIVIPQVVKFNEKSYTVTSLGRSFEWSTTLVSIVIPESVTRLENNAFSQCYNLSSVVLPKTLKFIGELAFFMCGKLSEITIPEGVEEIGGNVFLDCPLKTVTFECPIVKGCLVGTPVENVIIGKNVKSIEGGAFYKCTKLTSIIIPEGVSSMGAGVFSGCINLKTLHIPGSLGRIKNNILKGSSIENVTLGEGITEIALNSFQNNTYLREIKFPESLTNIGQAAFRGCTRLNSITLPKSITYLDYNTFADCPSITYVVVQAEKAFDVPENLFDESVYENATLYVNEGLKQQFSQTWPWSKFATIIDDDVPDAMLVSFFEVDGISYHVTAQKKHIVEIIRGNEPYEGNIVVHNKVKYANIEYIVKSIAEEAFTRGDGYNNDKLISVWIEDGVETIGKKAFQGCSSLKSLRLPNGLKRLEEYTLSGLSSLTYLKIPESIEYIGGGACSNLRSLTSLTIPESVKYIGGGAFYGIGVSSMTIPKNVYRIPANMLYNASVEKLDIMGSPHIESAAFSDCDKLHSVTFHERIASLGSYAFYNCKNLQSLSLPEGLKKLYQGTFWGCESLREVYLPASLEQIEPTAFTFHKPEAFLGDTIGSDNLQIIRVVDGGKYYDSRYGCNAVIDKRTNTLVLGCKNTVIPSDVTAIGDHAFLHRAGLKTIVIPEGVTSIGNYAFAGCADLESAELPQSLRSIGWCAFEDCVSLTNIRIPESVTTMGYWAFWGCENLGQVMVSAATPYEIEAKAFLQGLCVPTSLATISMPAESKLVRIYTTDGKLVKTLPAEEMKSPCEGLQRNRTYIIQSGQKSMKLRF